MTIEVAPEALALSDLTERLSEAYPDLALGVILRVVEAARTGTGSRLRTTNEIVADVERAARADLDDLRLLQPPRLPPD